MYSLTSFREPAIGNTSKCFGTSGINVRKIYFLAQNGKILALHADCQKITDK